MTKGWVEVAPPVDVFLSDAACFFACSSASFKDMAMAAFRSGSSSSSFDTPFVFAGSCFGCDCGTYPELEIPLVSSKLISNAFFKSSSKLLSTRALRGCIELGFGAKDTRRSETPPDLFVNFSWHPSSTRTGCMMPRCGRGMDFEEHC